MSLWIIQKNTKYVSSLLRVKWAYMHADWVTHYACIVACVWVCEFVVRNVEGAWSMSYKGLADGLLYVWIMQVLTTPWNGMVTPIDDIYICNEICPLPAALDNGLRTQVDCIDAHSHTHIHSHIYIFYALVMHSSRRKKNRFLCVYVIYHFDRWPYLRMWILN